jgi:hypothetical protein
MNRVSAHIRPQEAGPMRTLTLALFASLVGLVGFAGTADAQTRPANCPPISIVQQANGTVFLQANSNGVLPNNAINAIAFTSDPHLVGSQTNVAIDLPGQPPGQHPPLNVALNPAQPTYTFTLRPLVPGQAVTLPVTIADSCSAWPTFVGAGPGVIPTALPTQTPTPMPSATRTPTIVPTPTIPVFPTSTPLPATTVGYFPAKVLQGNKLIITFAGRPSPAINDYLVITNAAGVQQGPAIYTSSCTTTPGSVAVSAGSCTIQLFATFTPGTGYVVKLFANGGSGLLAQKTGLEVRQSGGALIGRGQAWGLTNAADDPAFGLAGGFLGAQSLLNTGDPAYQAPYSYNAVGLSDFGLIGDNFVEAGSYKLCFPSGQCEAFPYMSWLDNNSNLQSITWDGTGGAPNFVLPLPNSATFYTFKVFELAATRWTGEFCIPAFGCCPLWKFGDCSGVTAAQIPPRPSRSRRAIRGPGGARRP